MEIKKKDIVRHVQLQRLQPVQIGRRWGIIKPALIDGLNGEPLRSPEAQANLLAALQTGQIQCWAVLTMKEEKPALVGMVFTQILRDPLLGGSRLLIYAARAYNYIHSEAYISILDTLEEFARENKCDVVEAMTTVPKVRAMLEKFGWNTATTHTKEVSQ